MSQLLIHHNLGDSIAYSAPVTHEIGLAIWPTLLLVGTSTILASLLGTWFGITGAWNRGSIFDKISNGVAVTLYAMPEFWLGIILLVLLAGSQMGLGLFPTGGMIDDNVNGSSPAGWLNIAWHLTLPCLTLTLAYLAQYSLVMRSSMLDEMGQDYVRTARAKGLRDLLSQAARGAERAAAGCHTDPPLFRLRHLRRSHGGVCVLLARPRFAHRGRDQRRRLSAVARALLAVHGQRHRM